jgi:septal ring factor EnvC (AmiA/AmiB activator)
LGLFRHLHLVRLVAVEIATLPTVSAILENQFKTMGFVLNKQEKMEQDNVKENSIKSELKEIKTELKEIKTELKEIKTELKEIKTGLKEIKTDLKEIKTDLKEIKTDLKGFKTDLKEIKSIIGMGRNIEGRIVTSGNELAQKIRTTNTIFIMVFTIVFC